MFRAVARDRLIRESVPKRTTHPLHPWVALVAAAVLILAVIGVRYLGETRWKGRLESDRGARLLVSSDHKTFRIVTVDAPRDIGAGDLVLALPGQTGRILLPDGSTVVLSAPALVGLSTRRIDGADAPRVLLGRGFAHVKSGNGPPVTVAAGGQSFTVEDTAEFDVDEPSSRRAFSWTTSEIARGRPSRSIIETAWAQGAAGPATVTAHSLAGRILVPSSVGTVILSGQASSFGPGFLPGSPLPVGVQSVLQPISDVFDGPEKTALGDLLQETGGDRALLLAIVEDGVRKSVDRQMAAWLIGEMGVTAYADLKAAIDKLPASDVAVRAAAVAALTRLATGSAPWGFVSDKTPAVADAALFGCARMNFRDTVQRLRSVFADVTLPPDRRVYAAALLRDAGKPVGRDQLTGFLTSDDRTAAGLAADLLVDMPGGPSALAAVLTELDGWLATHILERLAGVRETPGQIESFARSALDPEDEAPDAATLARFRASLNYLRTRRAGGLTDAIDWALLYGDAPTKWVALRSLRSIRSAVDMEDYRERVETVLRDPELPGEVRMVALRLLDPKPAWIESLIDDPSPKISAEVRIEILDNDEEGRQGSLARGTLDHERDEARGVALAWFGKHEPEQFLPLVVAAIAAGADGADSAVIEGMTRYLGYDSEVPAFITGPESREQTAGILGWVLNQPDGQESTLLRAAALMGTLMEEGSPLAHWHSRNLVASRERPGSLRRRVAPVFAQTARSEDDFATLQKLLADPDIEVAEATAHALILAPPPAEWILTLRKLTLPPRIRARLALATPFDPDYTREVLRSGDARAIFPLVQRMLPAEATRVKAAVAEHLTHETVAIRLLALRLLAMTKVPFDIPARLETDPEPLIRVSALAARVARGESVSGEKILGTAGGASFGRGNDLPDLFDALVEQPGVENARAFLDQVNRAPVAIPVHPAEQAPGLHLRAMRVPRRGNRALALTQLTAEGPVTVRESAARALRRSGGRADIGVLLKIAGDADDQSELKRAAVSTVAALLSRRIDVAKPETALRKLEGWWRVRAFALEVPVLPREQD